MKKLIVAVAFACAIAASNAASFNWKTSATGKVYEAGTTTLLSSGTAYLFNAETVSQASVLAAFVAGTDISTLTYLDSSSISSGAIAAKTSTSDYISISVDAGTTVNAYFATIVDDSIFISATGAATAKDVGVSTISINAKAASQAAALDASAGYSTAGWYSAVPEPTSGLLMLLGVAGLALRRRRA